jgi:transposase
MSSLPSRLRQDGLRRRNTPDLNPIEQFFAKLKHWLRKSAQRTTEAVYDAITPILTTVSPVECANYFANAGYDPT